jgi:hypothetical protein
VTATDIARRAVVIVPELRAPLRRTILTAVAASDGTLHLLDCLPGAVSDLRSHGLVEQSGSTLTDLGRMVYDVLLHGADIVLAIAEIRDRRDTLTVPGEQVPTSLSHSRSDGEAEAWDAVDSTGRPAGNTEPISTGEDSTWGTNSAERFPDAVLEAMTRRGVPELRTRVTEQLGDVSLDWYGITAATLRAALADPAVSDIDVSDIGGDGCNDPVKSGQRTMVDADLLEGVLLDHVGQHATEEIFAAYDAAREASGD